MPRQIILSGHEETLKPAITELIALYQLLEDKDIGTVYSYPPENVIANVRHEKPKVILFFKSPKAVKKINGTEKRYEGLFSFRIMTKVSQNITAADVQQIAQKIKSEFATPPLVWNRGKLLCSYTDWDKGYQFQLIVSSRDNAKKIIRSALKIQGHTPNWALMNTVENEEPEERFDETPGKINILGESVAKPVKRRAIKTLFSYAYLYLPPKVEPIVLVSVDSRHRNPIIKI